MSINNNTQILVNSHEAEDELENKKWRNWIT